MAEKKCAHPQCKCSVSGGKEFCSDRCRNARTEGKTWACNHPAVIPLVNLTEMQFKDISTEYRQSVQEFVIASRKVLELGELTDEEDEAIRKSMERLLDVIDAFHEE